jgi:hypothetical protein
MMKIAVLSMRLDWAFDVPIPIDGHDISVDGRLRAQTDTRSKSDVIVSSRLGSQYPLARKRLIIVDDRDLRCFSGCSRLQASRHRGTC